MFKKIIGLVFISFVISSPAFSGPPPFCYQEEDGSPAGCFKKVKFANGTLTDNGDGTYSHSQAGAGGGDITDVGPDCSSGGCFVDGANDRLIFEGSTDNTVESILGATDPTVGDQTFNLPDMGAGASYTLATTASNVATSTALAANGANCGAGEYPLGVDASGAVESCTDATTEIASYSQPLEATLTDIADGTIAEDLVNTANPWADNEVADSVTAGNVEGTDLGTLTDTKACTYDLAGTEIDCATDFQPLESTLTDIADGTIAEDLVNTANPWADNEVADTITASNYLPLAGGTMTGELKLAAQGLEGTATDTLTDCSTFSATGGGIFFDDSEGQWKKCEDNVLTDLDTGGGGGDSVSIDSVGVVDPDFVSTGDIDFVDTSNTVTANIASDKVTEAKLKAVDAASDEDILTYESTTGDFEWHTIDQMIATMSAGGLPNDSILEADLKAVDAASDEECLTYETTTGDFEWQTCGSGSDTNAVKEYYWPASATLPLEAADSIPPISKDAGTNVDQLAVLFDSATDECRSVTFKVPSDVESGSTITFRSLWYSTATSGSVMWDFRHTSGDTEGETWDDSLTTESAASDAVQGTTKQITVTTWTETLANLGWAANDLVTGVFCRDGNGTAGTDDMAADAYAIGFGVEIPRA